MRGSLKMQLPYKLVLLVSRMPGLNPFHRNKFSKIRKWITFAFLFYINTLMLLELLLNFQGLKTLVKLDMLPAMMMAMAKLLAYHYNEDNLLNILDATEKLWPLDKFGSAVETKMLRMHRYTFYYLLNYLCSFIFCGFGFFALPVLLHENNLGLPGYEVCDREVPPCFEIQHAVQIVGCYGFSTPMIYVFDCMFLAITVQICTAVEMLKQGFQHFDADASDSEEKLKELVDQHITLLRLIEETDKFYNDSLLFQYVGSTAQLFFCLYMLSSEGIPPPSKLLIKYGVVYVIFLAQLFQFCICGTIIAEKTKTIADEAFFVNWWSATHPILRRNLRFVIDVAQKGKQLTVGKMLNLDLDSFVQVLKISLQIYMLMSAVEIAEA